MALRLSHYYDHIIVGGGWYSLLQGLEALSQKKSVAWLVGGQSESLADFLPYSHDFLLAKLSTFWSPIEIQEHALVRFSGPISVKGKTFLLGGDKEDNQREWQRKCSPLPLSQAMQNFWPYLSPLAPQSFYRPDFFCEPWWTVRPHFFQKSMVNKFLELGGAIRETEIDYILFKEDHVRGVGLKCFEGVVKCQSLHIHSGDPSGPQIAPASFPPLYRTFSQKQKLAMVDGPPRLMFVANPLPGPFPFLYAVQIPGVGQMSWVALEAGMEYRPSDTHSLIEDIKANFSPSLQHEILEENSADWSFGMTWPVPSAHIQGPVSANRPIFVRNLAPGRQQIPKNIFLGPLS